MLTKKDLENLEALARIEVSEKEKKKLLKDLEKILAHFEELKEVIAEGPGGQVSGGTFSKNVFRQDADLRARLPAPERSDGGQGQDPALTEQFPEKEKGFLKIPPVFSAEGGSPPDGRAGASGGE